MLDIHRGDHVDSRREQFLDVLVALLMLGAGDVGVREFVDQRDLRLARQDSVDIHLFHRHAAVIEPAARDHLKVPLLGHGVGRVRWVSMKPSTTSTPLSRSSCASSSIRHVLPTPAAAPT